MSKLKIDQGEWVVVCDGRKALILENIGDRISPNLRTAETREHPDHVDARAGYRQPGPRARLGRHRAQQRRADRLA